MNTDSTGFRYTDHERTVISSSCLPKKLNDEDWRYLETIAAVCQNTSLSRILDRRSATRIGKIAKKLELLLKDVPPDKARPRELPMWLEAVNAIWTWAEPQQLPKSARKRSNRARPDGIDGYLALLVLFYMQCCGRRPGLGPSSRCARFVIAAASPVLTKTYFEMAPHAISHLIRSRAWFLGQDFATERPEIGKPALAINAVPVAMA